MGKASINNKTFYIYGAGIVATSIYTAIKEMYNYVPEAFLVSDLSGNPNKIDGIPVWELAKVTAFDNLCKYLIATPVSHHEEIADNLQKLGVRKEQLIFVDNKLENKLMGAYYCGLQEFLTVSELLQSDNKQRAVDKEIDIVIFQAKCHVDRPLNKMMKMPNYVLPIQVGSALTDKVITDVRDNVGENISEKNSNYCELTATYYAWKNSQAQYKGLCHYRRIFDLTDAQLERLLLDMDVDVILPYPSVHYPNVSRQHTRCIDEKDWKAALRAMKEVAPDYYKTYVDGNSQECYFYNFNMLVARREVFDDYCCFLFSVLEKTEELIEPKEKERSDRFAGYLGENLTSLYFRKNKDKLKIAHVGKLWLL